MQQRNLVSLMVFAILLAPFAMAECVTPFTGMRLSSSRSLCSGEYEAENIMVEGIGTAIDCNHTILNGNGQNAGIRVEYAQRIAIRGCTLQNYEAGISVKNSEDVVLENNLFIRNKVGIAEQGSTTSLKGNTFEESLRQDVMSIEAMEEATNAPIAQAENASLPVMARKQIVLKNPSAGQEEVERRVEAFLQRIDASQELLDIQRTVAIDEEAKTTTITLSLSPKQPLENVSIYEGIPKCLAEYLSQVVFSNNEFEVIEEDPLIMWTFSQMNEKSRLSYVVRRVVSKECSNLLVGFGIAAPSTPPPKAEKLIPQKVGKSRIAFVVIVILFTAVIAHRGLSKARHRKR